MTVAGDVRLEGELVILRPRVDDDLPLFARWHGDPDVRHWLHMSEMPNQSLEVERQRWHIARNDPTRVSFIIETLEGVPIGNIGLISIDAAHRRSWASRSARRTTGGAATARTRSASSCASLSRR